jgi:hypothetical protein
MDKMLMKIKFSFDVKMYGMDQFTREEIADHVVIQNDLAPIPPF